MNKPKLRSVNTHFWSDTYVIELDPIEKLLFLYLLTNEQTNMLGIYELHIRRIAFDTGIDKDMLLKIFERFESANKCKYLNGYVILRNFVNHQSYNSNMKISAVNSWRELPLDIQKDVFCKHILNALKGFGKASEGLGKVEVEVEVEIELFGARGSTHKKLSLFAAAAAAAAAIGATPSRRLGLATSTILLTKVSEKLSPSLSLTVTVTPLSSRKRLTFSKAIMLSKITTAFWPTES